MKHRIIEKEGINIVGKSKRISFAAGENLRDIPAFWDELRQLGHYGQMVELAGVMGLLGVCLDFDQDQHQFTYMVAVEKPQGEIPEGFQEAQIPAATWATFEVVGPLPHSIQEAWAEIWGEWFPTSGFQHANAPELEIYPLGDPTDINYKCEVWVPIL